MSLLGTIHGPAGIAPKLAAYSRLVNPDYTGDLRLRMLHIPKRVNLISLFTGEELRIVLH